MTHLDQAAKAAGELKDTVIFDGQTKEEAGYFELSSTDGVVGRCAGYHCPFRGPTDPPMVFSLELDGMALDDVERVFKVLRLGAKADRALDESLAYAAEY